MSELITMIMIWGTIIPLTGFMFTMFLDISTDFPDVNAEFDIYVILRRLKIFKIKYNIFKVIVIYLLFTIMSLGIIILVLWVVLIVFDLFMWVIHSKSNTANKLIVLITKLMYKINL